MSKRAVSIPDELMAGATVKGVAAPPVRSRVYAPGHVVLGIEVIGKPIPWKVSIRPKGKGPPTNPKLAAWQRRVRDEAALAMRGRPPHSGPFALSAWFGVAGAVHGDLTNLLKSLEDAIEGVAFVNDRAAREHRAYLVTNDVDRVFFVVTAL